MEDRSSAGKWIAIIIVVVIIIAAAVWWSSRRATPAPGAMPMAPAASATASSSPQYPISAAHASLPAATSTTQSTAFDDSDADAEESLPSLIGDSALQHLLVKSDLIPRIVATIDALPHRELGRNILPVRAPAGLFATTSDAGQVVIGADNAARYAPYMDWITHADTTTLVAWYVRHYAQFQQAYRQLGYPDGYFNDRLIAVIDHLLVTPTVSTPIAVTQPHVLYEFADPALQRLSAGQKMLIRTGPSNEAAIKTKLHTVRAALTGAPLRPAAPSTAP